METKEFISVKLMGKDLINIFVRRFKEIIQEDLHCHSITTFSTSKNNAVFLSILREKEDSFTLYLEYKVHQSYELSYLVKKEFMVSCEFPAEQVLRNVCIKNLEKKYVKNLNRIILTTKNVKFTPGLILDDNSEVLSFDFSYEYDVHD